MEPLQQNCPFCQTRQLILLVETSDAAREPYPVRCITCGATFVVYLPKTTRIEGPFSIDRIRDATGQPTKSGLANSHRQMHPELPAALAVLDHALDNCREHDMRTPEVIDAIKLLLKHADERGPFVQFWKALGETGSADGKWRVANAALNGIRLTIGFR